ncbi:MAG: thermonuclease family protein [archaeon]|nr:thermonuclease family protein [archaeon]
MERKTYILIIMVIVTGVLYYMATEEVVVQKSVKIVRVIDGDTVETSAGEKIRLKGINTPEKGISYYLEAKNLLENLVLNKSVELDSYGLDQYGRILGHIYFGDVYVNGELVKNGLAFFYYYGEDKHSEELLDLEDIARGKEIGLWKKSPDFGCLELIELRYKEPGERCTGGELLRIGNSCDKSFNFTIKDDATHIYREFIEKKGFFEKNFSCIFNDDGDSLYVSDDKGLLIFHRY